MQNGREGVSYSPNGRFSFLMAGQTATDTFRYTISDGNGGQATATVIVTITGPNIIPTALNDVAMTFEDQSIAVQVLSNAAISIPKFSASLTSMAARFR